MIYINDSRTVGQISLFFICVFCVVLTSPFFSAVGTETVLITLLSCSLLFYNGYNAISSASKGLVFLNLLFLTIMIVYKILGVSSADWVYPAGYMGWMFTSILGCYLVKNANYTQLKILFGTIYIACVGYCAYISVIGNRVMQDDVELGVELATAMYSSAFMLFSGSCLILFLNVKEIPFKILAMIGIMIPAYANFAVLQRGTNAIFSIVLYALILLFNGKRSRFVYVFFFFLLIVLLVIFQTGLYVYILDGLINVISSERIASRIDSLNVFLQTGDYVYAGTSVRTRSILLVKTWTTFTNSFPDIMFGVGDHRNYTGPIGNHNELIDMLARYGIVFSAPLFVILFKQYAWFKELFYEYKSNKVYFQAIAVFVIYIARNIIGSALTSAVSIQMFLFLPIVVIMVKNQELFIINQKKWRL